MPQIETDKVLVNWMCQGLDQNSHLKSDAPPKEVKGEALKRSLIVTSFH